MNAVKRVMIGLVAAALVVGKAAASPELTGTITELWVNDGSNSNVVFISVGTTFISACGASSKYLIIDLSEPGMKEAYAMALASSFVGQGVTMAGIGSCHGQLEKLRYIKITP